MKTSYIALVVAMAASVIGVSTSAHASPFALDAINGAATIQYRSTFDNAGGQKTMGTLFIVFGASTFDDMAGVKQGSASANFIELSTFQQSFIQCSGPEFARAISVNPGNGNTAISATLDPANPNCFSIDVNAPLTLNLAGQLNDTHHISQSGIQTQRFGAEVFKQNFRFVQFSETFNGTVGPVLGPFDGGAQAYRSTNRQRLK